MGKGAQFDTGEKLVIDKKAFAKWLVGAAVVVSAIAGFVIYNSSANTAARDIKARMEVAPSLAERACQRQVEGQLKSPRTAKFNDLYAQGDGNYRFTVTGTVDAENSFGALVRSEIICDITVTETTTLAHNVTVQ